MDVKDAISKRRAYRSLEKVEITDEILRELGEAAQLTMSCFNNQPWRFIFVTDEGVLQELFTALSKGNVWAHKASMIIAVTSRKDLDCELKERDYYLFDTGMATAFLVLRATEMGLVAHPIAGYDVDKVKEILEIPEDMTLITLVIVGKHADTISPVLSEKQARSEKERPERNPLEEFVFKDKYPR